MVLSKQSISKNLKKWGFNSYHENVHTALSNSLNNYAQRQNTRIQNGGRVTMPQEYFGIDSGKYQADAPGPSLTVTDEWIRPPADTSDPTGVIVGGGQRRFTVSQDSFNKATTGMGMSSQQKRAIKASYEKKMTELLNAVEKKNRRSSEPGHLEAETFLTVAGQKKYSELS
jgi:hypothetical protein